MVNDDKSKVWYMGIILLTNIQLLNNKCPFVMYRISLQKDLCDKWIYIYIYFKALTSPLQSSPFKFNLI